MAHSSRGYRRTYEDELKELKGLYIRITAEDAAILSQFISSQPEERRIRDDTLTPPIKCLGYARLADLLRLLDTYTILSIVDADVTRFQTLRLVRQLRRLSFEGSWLDSVETVIVSNAGNGIHSLKKLEESERSLKETLEELRARKDGWTQQEQLTETELAHANAVNDFNSSEKLEVHLSVLRARKDWLTQEEQLTETELAQITDKKNSLLRVRARLRVKHSF